MMNECTAILLAELCVEHAKRGVIRCLRRDAPSSQDSDVPAPLEPRYRSWFLVGFYQTCTDTCDAAADATCNFQRQLPVHTVERAQFLVQKLGLKTIANVINFNVAGYLEHQQEYKPYNDQF
jgi:hypothetical protein